jgi:hypothetical protein
MLSALVALTLVLAFGSIISAICFAGEASRNRKPGVPYFPGRWESPNNILFRPDQLSPAGLVARRRCFISLAVFAGAFAILLLLAVCHVPG